MLPRWRNYRRARADTVHTVTLCFSNVLGEHFAGGISNDYRKLALAW